MSGHLPPDRARLLALAEAQPVDPAVRESWPAVVTAIRGGWLLPGDGPYSIPESIDRLERTGLVSVEEYAIEEDDADPDSLLVTLISDTRRVPREAFLRELRRLDDDFRAGRGPAPEPEPPPDPPSLPDPERIREVFQQILGAPGLAPDSPEAERVRREARTELEHLSAAPDDEVRTALGGLTTADRERMAEALRTFAAWAEQPERRGDLVDDVIRGLEDTIGRLLPGRRAEERETDERIRSSAQDAIARRLRGE